MPIPKLGSPKWILGIGGVILVLFGLMFSLLVIHTITHREGSLGDKALFSALAVVPIVIGALLIKSSFTSDLESTLLSAHIDPIEILKKAKTDSEKELAHHRLEESYKIAAKLTARDNEVLEQIKTAIRNTPPDNEVANRLKQRGVENLVLGNSRIQPVAFALRPVTTSQYLKGIILGILTWCGALIFVPLFSLTGMGLGKEALAQVLRLDRRARRYRIRPHKELIREPRDPILYLRSFLEDYEDDPNRFTSKTTEEKQIDSYSRYGPVLAVGQPKETLPLLGATRLYFDDNSWQIGVLYLMSIAQAVVIQAGIAPGLLWELGVARKRVEPEKLIVSFGGWDDLDGSKREVHYLRFKKFAEELLECELPTRLKNADCITFDNSWMPKGFTLSDTPFTHK